MPSGRRFMAVDQARQEAGQRLAAARRRDEEGRLPIDESIHHRALVVMRLPAAAGEPLRHIVRQAFAQILDGPGLCHGV